MRARISLQLALGLTVLVVVIGVFGLAGDNNRDWSEDVPDTGWKDGGKRGEGVQDVTLDETRGDNFNADANATALTPAVGNKKPRTTGIVELRFMGRLGNNLFEYAAARSLADRKGWALFLRTAPANPRKYGTLLREDGMSCFPGVRGLGPSTDSPEMKNLAWSRFRGLQQELADDSPRRIVMESWFQEYSLFSDTAGHLREATLPGKWSQELLDSLSKLPVLVYFFSHNGFRFLSENFFRRILDCTVLNVSRRHPIVASSQVMALNSSCCGETSPGGNDLVIHFRNYRAELTEQQYEKLIFKDLDFEYYDQVLRDVANSKEGAPETIWVVGEFEKEGNSLINHLRKMHGDVRKAEGVDGQFEAFCFLSRAPRLVMAPSTFSWWTAFLGSASEVHFPLFPRGRGVTVPRIMVKNDPRYVYRNIRGDAVKAP